MLILLPIASLIAIMFHPFLSESAATVSVPIHQICLSYAPDSRHRDLYAALICGASSISSSLRESLTTTGLIHIIVASGTHVLFLEQLINFAAPKRVRRLATFQIVSILLLLAFVLINRAAAPVTRALISLLVLRANEKLRLSFHPVQRATLASLLTLSFCAADKLGSLYLSWLAGLIVVGFQSQAQSSELDTSLRFQTRLYVLLFPALLPFAAPHPLSIICNFILVPVFGILLIPVSLLGFLIPLALPVTDAIWDLALYLIRSFASQMPEVFRPLSVPKSILWLYLAGLTLLAWPRKSNKERS